jgi:hypothetical protein
MELIIRYWAGQLASEQYELKVHPVIKKNLLRVRLVYSKFQKFYKISRHIESLDAYMEY